MREIFNEQGYYTDFGRQIAHEFQDRVAAFLDLYPDVRSRDMELLMFEAVNDCCIHRRLG